MKKGKTNPSSLPTSSHDGLGNPALIAVASVVPWGFIFKTAVVCGVTYYVVSSFKRRFVSLNNVGGYNNANISNAEATMKADVIYQAMKGWGNGFKTVRENIAGLNYNAWVKVYNAFGNRSDSIPFSEDKNLIEWFQSEFNENELSELRVLVPNVF